MFFKYFNTNKIAEKIIYFQPSFRLRPTLAVGLAMPVLDGNGEAAELVGATDEPTEAAAEMRRAAASPAWVLGVGFCFRITTTKAIVTPSPQKPKMPAKTEVTVKVISCFS